MNDFGSSLFKMQSGTASAADIISVLSMLSTNEKARQRCAALSTFVSGIPEAERAANCESVISMFFASQPVPDAPTPTPVGASRGSLLPFEATVHFVRSCCPPPKSRWQDHVIASYDKNGKPTRASVAESVGVLIQAVEHLWGVPGRLVTRR
jgi:hypothetical protein